MTRRTRKSVITILSSLGLAVIIGLVPLQFPQLSQAQGPEKPIKGELSTAKPPIPPVSEMQRRQTLDIDVPGVAAATMREQVNVIIELETSSAAEAAGPALMQSATTLQNQAARVRTAQTSLLGQIDAQGINYQLLGSTQITLNAIAVRTDARNLSALNALPGVRTAYVERIGTLDNSTSVPFIAAPTVWSYGYTGGGVTVALIDSGINYLHANFGDPTTGAPAPSLAASTKIAGGYDFVGDTWHPIVNPVYTPDADPMDQNGHGTHVAGTMAGYGMTTAGTTFGGPWNAATPFDTLAIGPGVAPEATIFAYKVGAYAAEGYVSEFATIQALEQAVLDGVDVINMSIGGNFGNPDIGWARAADNTAQLGILIASSAGNAGDTYFVQGDPSTADWVLSVASSVDGSRGFNVTVAPTASVVGTYEATAASFGPATYDVTADLEYVNDGTGVATDGCEALVGFTSGTIALIDRGACNFTTKVANAQAAGAAGVLIANTSTGAFVGLGGDDPTITIPSVMIRYSVGLTLKSELTSGIVTVNLDNDIFYGATADTLSSFSSRGPQRGVNGEDIALKPDITAPGNGITSSYLGSATAVTTISGTSMASPHVAGALALLRQQHPTWTVPEIKALAMNTATNFLYTEENQSGDIYGPARVGAGRLSVSNAFDSEVIAYNAANPELVSVSFGVRNVSGPGSLSKNITVENKSEEGSYSFDVLYAPSADIAGTSVQYTVTPSTVTVPPGGSTTVTVTLNYTDPATWAFANTHDPTVSETQGGLPRHWLPEESGVVQFISSESGEAFGPDLWVPVYASLRPAGTMAALESDVAVSELVGTTGIALGGTPVLTADEFGVVTAFELLYESPDDPYVSIGTNRADYPPYSDMADIQYLGLTTDYYSTGSVDGSLISLGIATYGEWTSLAEEVWFETYFDIDEDASPDYVMYNWNYGAYGGSDATDTYILLVIDLTSGSVVYIDFMNWFPSVILDTYAMRNNVLFFSLPAAALGLSDTNPDFDFFTVGRQINAAEVLSDVDITPVLSYDIAAQPIDFSGGFSGEPAFWLDLPGEEIPVSYNFETVETPVCALLLHHHNVTGQRAETVCYTVAEPEPITEPDPDPDPDPVYEEEWTPADPADVTVLPSTGYPPADATETSSNLPLFLAAGALALVVTVGGVLIRRRSRS